jgi:endonuclease YncB( thermonuclease family)
MLVSSSILYFNDETFARCPNGYHKSPSGDCEKVITTKGLPRCPNGYHRSPDGDCEKVGGSGGNSKKCSSGYHKDEETDKCNKVNKKSTSTDPKSQSNSNKKPQGEPSGLPGDKLNYFINRTCQGIGSCFDGTVTKVVDGDTLDIDNVRIRLALVNTPETFQDGYTKAKQFVETNCGVGTHAMIDEDGGQKSGSYGRMIGLVFCENLVPSLNKAILTSGNAEILTQYCSVSEFSGKDWARQYGC